MFDATCTECGKRHLIFPSQISSLRNTRHGVELDYTCWCGSPQSWSAHPAGDRDLVAA